MLRAGGNFWIRRVVMIFMKLYQGHPDELLQGHQTMLRIVLLQLGMRH
jgi:hypothetical protein